MAESLKYGEVWPKWLLDSIRASPDAENELMLVETILENETEKKIENVAANEVGNEVENEADDTILSRPILSNRRYSKEEFLSMCEESNDKSPEYLPHFKRLHVNKWQLPLSFQSNEEEKPPSGNHGHGRTFLNSNIKGGNWRRSVPEESSWRNPNVRSSVNHANAVNSDNKQGESSKSWRDKDINTTSRHPMVQRSPKQMPNLMPFTSNSKVKISNEKMTSIQENSSNSKENNGSINNSISNKAHTMNIAPPPHEVHKENTKFNPSPSNKQAERLSFSSIEAELMKNILDISLNDNSSPLTNSSKTTAPAPPPTPIKWFYVDPRGVIQGPFKGGDEMDTWYHNGFFNDCLLVRRSIDDEFFSLGQLVKAFGPLHPFTAASNDFRKQPNDDHLASSVYNTNTQMNSQNVSNINQNQCNYLSPEQQMFYMQQQNLYTSPQNPYTQQNQQHYQMVEQQKNNAKLGENLMFHPKEELNNFDLNLLQYNQNQAHSLINQSPAHPMINQSPANSLIKQNPAHSLINQSPAHSMINQSPVHSMINQSPAHSLINQNPAHHLINQSPVHSMINQNTIHSLLNQNSARSLVNQSPVHSMINQNTVHSLLNQNPAHSLVNQSPVHPMIDQNQTNSLVNQSPLNSYINQNQSHSMINQIPQQDQNLFMDLTQKPVIDPIQKLLLELKQQEICLKQQQKQQEDALSVNLYPLKNGHFPIKNEASQYSMKHFEKPLSMDNNEHLQKNLNIPSPQYVKQRQSHEKKDKLRLNFDDDDNEGDFQKVECLKRKKFQKEFKDISEKSTEDKPKFSEINKLQVKEPVLEMINLIKKIEKKKLEERTTEPAMPAPWLAKTHIDHNTSENLKKIQNEEEEYRQYQLQIEKEREKELEMKKRGDQIVPTNQMSWNSVVMANSDNLWSDSDTKSSEHVPANKKKPTTPRKIVKTHARTQDSKEKSSDTNSKDQLNELKNWCIDALKKIKTKEVDVPAFIAFLQVVDSPFEIEEYVKTYLGDTKECNDFTREFLERRSIHRNVTKKPHDDDDLACPAKAINPGSSNETQKSQKKKENYLKKQKNKSMKVVDANILGFKTTAASNRIVGEIENEY